MLAYCKTCLPATEVRENESGYTVTMELPGSSRNDVKIWQENNVLTVTAEKKAPEGNKVWTERVFGKFERSFSIPQDADKENIEANYTDGVVTVSIPKLEVARPRDIKIN
jgi:HSP20 family protein